MSEKQFLRHGLNGNQLKLIAVVSMLCDHAAIRLLAYGLIPALYAVGEDALAERWNQVFWILRSAGRMAFPIYVFLLTEGFCHTRNRRRYALRLGVFALISEIPFDLLVYGKIWDTHSQNVFFTLFLGYLAFCLINRFKENPTMQLMSMLVLLAVSYFLKADYGYKGYVFLLIMFWLHQYKPAQALIGSCWLIYEWKACFAFISLNMYNGKRGFIRGKWAKYFFYAFYPVHIAILTIIRKKWFGI